jgi:hypothetical protein
MLISVVFLRRWFRVHHTHEHRAVVLRRHRRLGPRGFWPWYWAASRSVAGLAWLAQWIAAQKFTGISPRRCCPARSPPQYLWAVIALVAVLVVFYLSDRTYKFLERFFLVIMWGNIALVLVVVAIAAKPHHYWDVLMGFLGITFLTQGGYPAKLPLTDTLALFGQPGGSIMYVSFWVIGAGFAMGKFAGQVTGPLRPPENVTVEEMRWDTNDASERAKMRQWVKLGGYSLFLWWGLIGGILMVYLLRGRVCLSARGVPQDGQGPRRRGGGGADGDGGRGRPRTDGGLADAALHHGHPL